MDYSAKRLEVVQLLRAIAVTCVVISHIAHELKNLLMERLPSFDEKLFPGDFGVDLFFVISGFIMVYTCWDKFARPGEIVNFARKRLVRIVPLYWILTSVMIGVILILPNSVSSTSYDVQYWISSYLFIPYARESDGLIRPVMALGWSLQFEMFFYVLFGLCLFFTRRIGLILAMTLLVCVPLIMNALDGSTTIIRFLGNSIFWEFAFGIFIGIAFKKQIMLPNIAGLGFFCAGVVLLLLAPSYNAAVDEARYLYYGGPALLMVASATLTPYGSNMMIARPFLMVGEASYSMYLSHPFVIGFAALIAEKMELTNTMGPLGFIFMYGAGVFFSIFIIGYLVHMWLDTPAAKLVGTFCPPVKKPAQ